MGLLLLLLCFEQYVKQSPTKLRPSLRCLLLSDAHLRAFPTGFFDKFHARGNRAGSLRVYSFLVAAWISPLS